MSIEDRIAQLVADSGMTIRAVSSKTGIPYGRLYPCIQGRRELRADEFLSLCLVLHIDPNEFCEESA